MAALQLQRCTFKRKKDSPWEYGVAKVASFDMSDVGVIMDRDLKKMRNVWDYRLETSNGFIHNVYLELPDVE